MDETSTSSDEERSQRLYVLQYAEIGTEDWQTIVTHEDAAFLRHMTFYRGHEGRRRRVVPAPVDVSRQTP